MSFKSIRWRLQAWHGLILVAVLAGFGLTAYHVARDNQLRRIDQDLDQRLMSVFRPEPPGPPSEGPGHRHEPGHPWFRAPDFRAKLKQAVEQAGSLESSQTNGIYYVLWDKDGSLLARSPGAPTEVPAPERLEPGARPVEGGLETEARQPEPRAPGPDARTRGELRECYRFMPGGECLLAGHYLSPDLAAMHRLALWLFAAGSSVLLLGLAGGWWLATRAIRPIEDISATALKIAGGDLSQRINAADTESELGRLAAVLNSTFSRLEAAFAHQARFTSDASHELRTPVSVIISQTQTALSRERPGPEYCEALQACQRAAQRMRGLIESLLELARLDAGQEPMKRERFDLAQVARDGVELVRPLADERGIKITCDISVVECLGDAERIGQVATNLLTNAIQFNRPQGEVSVSARKENGAAFLIVTDNGEGIAAEHLPHLFERFYRADKSRSRIAGQTGLGLAICKAIVDAHSGTIEVSSRPGEGSTFTVRLPLA
jgi:signal transduction histidine kinase